MGLSKGVSLYLPDVLATQWAETSVVPRQPPEVTFTPTAAGLRREGGHLPGIDCNLQTMLLEALSKIMVAGMQQGAQGPCQAVHPQPQLPGCLASRPDSHSHRDSVSTGDSVQGEDDPEDMEFSEDEGLLPDKLAFNGLFRPSLFKSLLHKAKVTTNIGVSGPSPAQAQGAAGLHDVLFKSSTLDKDFIPCPQLFVEVVQTPWSQPGSLTTPSGHDEKFYCLAPELEDLLALPSVDAPVASLSSSSVISTDIVDGLQAEDRKAELSFRKAHQAATWAIKATMSTSFFSDLAAPVTRATST